MIGPGTGVAPMRALLQERSHLMHKMKLSVGPNVLYFGCKKRKLDYIYQDEIEAFQKSKDISYLRSAFSREQDQKVYVQHLLEEDAEKIWDMVDSKGAHIYVCGGTKMGQDVNTTFRNIAMKVGGVENEDAARKYYENLVSNGRFVQELWA